MCFGGPTGQTPQIFDATFANSIFNQQRFLTVQGYTPGGGYPLPLLPFTIPVRKNFQYALAQQANLTIEREITKDWKVSVGYNYTHGTHLDHTVNLNVTDPALLMANDSNAVQAGLFLSGQVHSEFRYQERRDVTPTQAGSAAFLSQSPERLVRVLPATIAQALLLAMVARHCFPGAPSLPRRCSISSVRPARIHRFRVFSPEDTVS